MVRAATGRTAPLPCRPPQHRLELADDRLALRDVLLDVAVRAVAAALAQDRDLVAQRFELGALAVPLLQAVVVPQRVREDVRGLDAAQLAPVLAGAARPVAASRLWGCLHTARRCALRLPR